MLFRSEERQHHPDAPPPDVDDRVHKRLQDRVLRWVAQRVAEQRVLWNLRRHTSAVAIHPQDMPFDQVMSVVRRTLEHDFDRHQRWLVVDGLGLIASAVLMPLPGPNIVAYYFAFRVVGHWLSMRGASQGLERMSWSGRPCPPLAELREVLTLDSHARDERVHDIAARLRLQHLSTFFERVGRVA